MKEKNIELVKKEKKEKEERGKVKGSRGVGRKIKGKRMR